MNPQTPSVSDPSKAVTGIEGFDEITHGGLPRGRATVLEGGPGSGKTLMALQTLVNGAQKEVLTRSSESSADESTRGRTHLHELRGAAAK